MTRLNISVKSLFEGCILSSIAHAVWASKYPFAKYNHYWEQNHCHFNNMSGTIATISFYNEGAIGAIFKSNYTDEHSTLTSKDNLIDTLNILPENLRLHAENETIQYFIQDINSEKKPVITNLFWSENNFLVSTQNESEWAKIWSDTLKAHLLDYSNRILFLKKDYNLSELEIEFITDICQQKISNPEEEIKFKITNKFTHLFDNCDEQLTVDLLKRLKIILINE